MSANSATLPRPAAPAKRPRAQAKPLDSVGQVQSVLAERPPANGAAGGSAKRAPSATPRPADYQAFYRLSTADRVDVVKAGVPASFVDVAAYWLGQPKERLTRMLGLSQATVNRKVAKGQALSPEQGERVLGVAQIIGLVQTMVEQSGDPQGFAAPAWVAHWLDEPLPALGGRKPADYMDTQTGQGLVLDLLRRSQSGAYS